MDRLNLQQHLSHLWERLKHEDDMLNHRLSWLWTLQGLLFASFGLLSKELGNMGKLPIFTVCVVGIISCLSVGYSTLKGYKVINVLHPLIRTIEKKIESELQLERTKTVEPEVLAFLHPWRFLPWAFFCAWIVLISWVAIV